MSETNYIGNISTIVKYISMTIAGLAIGALVSHGIDLNIDQSALSELIGAIIFFILAQIDASNPNDFKFLGNQNPQNNTQEPPKVEQDDNDDSC